MLLLDSEALSAIAHGPAGRRDRVRALITEMRRHELPITTVAAVLAKVVRGRAADAAVFAGLRRQRVEVRPVDTAVGVRAGQLLGAVGAGWELAVDAFVVAVADLARGAVVATVDTGDLTRLASRATDVTGRVDPGVRSPRRFRAERCRLPPVREQYLQHRLLGNSSPVATRSSALDGPALSGASRHMAKHVVRQVRTLKARVLVDPPLDRCPARRAHCHLAPSASRAEHTRAHLLPPLFAVMGDALEGRWVARWVFRWVSESFCRDRAAHRDTTRSPPSSQRRGAGRDRSASSSPTVPAESSAAPTSSRSGFQPQTRPAGR